MDSLVRSTRSSLNLRLMGLVGVSKTVMAELTDSTNSAAAFSMIPIMWSAGVTIGPLIGGLLSNPAWKWALFDTSFFHQYPYFLPCAVAGFLALLAGILGAIYLQEVGVIWSIVNEC